MTILLIIATLLSATLSGILGMAGGVTLLAVMAIFLDYRALIPLHGIVQLVSNASRTVLFLRHVRWGVFVCYVVGLMPGAFAGMYLVRVLPPQWMKPAIGAVALLMTFYPKRKGASRARLSVFPIVGLAGGVLTVTVGAVGPLIAPLFVRNDIIKEQLVATKAVCQAAGHLIKVVLFALAGQLFAFPSFPFAQHGALIVGMGVAAVLGTIAGKRILTHVSPALFVRLFQVVMVLVCAKLILYDGAYKLLFSPNPTTQPASAQLGGTISR